MKTAVIAGATGLVGSELLSQLVKEETYDKIHVILRKEIEITSPKVIPHILDFEKLNEFQIPGSVHHIFCTLGTTIKKAGTKDNFRKVDFDYVLELGKKAREWKVEKFLIVSALGSNSRSAIFYNRIKGEVENALKEIGLPQLFIFRPSLLMGKRKEHRAGEKTAIAVYKIINPLFIGKLRKYKGIQADRVARAMVQTALKNKEQFKILESNELQNF
ncbi:MAG: oxidoreductase [Bacteroidales bacterium]|nr:oxidoreductase [Bacteroidales bacterium]MCF8402590.1 oxidoreductase [Bacteroidales bacterium]